MGWVVEARALIQQTLHGRSQAALTPGIPGRLARLLDDTRGLWLDNGTRYYALHGGRANIEAFGAVGDGLTDNTAAIQEAIDASSGRIWVPPGVFLTGSLYLPSLSDVAGAGWQSILKLVDNVGGRNHLFQPQNAAVDVVVGVKLRNVKLLGNSAGQWGGGPMPNATDSIHGIAVLGGVGWTIERVWSEDFDGDGIYLGRHFDAPVPQQAFLNRVVDCHVEGNIRNGMMIACGRYNVLERSTFMADQVGMVVGNPKYAPGMYQSAELDLEPNVNGEDVNYNVITKCRFLNGNYQGIQLSRPIRPVVGNIIDQCWFVDNAANQIMIAGQGQNRTIITRNHFISSVVPKVSVIHIRVMSGNYTQIVGNHFQGGTLPDGVSRAIQVDDGGTGDRPRRTVFRENIVDFSDSVGDAASILFTNCDESEIGPNTLIGATYENQDSSPRPELQTMQVWLADDVQVATMGELPPNSYVMNVRLQVTEGFDSDGTDEISVGYDGSTEAFATLTDVTMTGIKAVILGAEAGRVGTARTVKAYYVNGGTEPTQGKALVILEYYQISQAIA